MWTVPVCSGMPALASLMATALDWVRKSLVREKAVPSGSLCGPRSIVRVEETPGIYSHRCVQDDGDKLRESGFMRENGHSCHELVEVLCSTHFTG